PECSRRLYETLAPPDRRPEVRDLRLLRRRFGRGLLRTALRHAGRCFELEAIWRQLRIRRQLGPLDGQILIARGRFEARLARHAQLAAAFDLLEVGVGDRPLHGAIAGDELAFEHVEATVLRVDRQLLRAFARGELDPPSALAAVPRHLAGWIREEGWRA